MEFTLAAVTAIALALVIVTAVMLARVMREERRRSEARVALLQDLAADQGAPSSIGERGAPATPARSPAVVRPRASVPQRSWADDLVLHPERAGDVLRADLFQPAAEPSPWPRRLTVAAALALTVAIGSFAWSAVSGPKPARPTDVAETTHPLELLSLEHAQEGGMLSVTGLIQNPRAGRVLSSVDATVLVYDRSGTLLASGRSPIDFRVLSPGDESPFVIRVPVNGTVARYRIGFRGQQDRVLGHIDRRTADSLARKQDP